VIGAPKNQLLIKIFVLVALAVLNYCPDACILMKLDKNGKLKAEVDYDYCKGCGLCASECPVKAIIMKKDEKYEK